MQPDPLAPLFAPLTTLRGVGASVATLIAKAAGGERVIDLLFHLPESYTDRRARPAIAQAEPGVVATLSVEVVRHEPPANSRQPWRVVVKDASGFADLVFFVAHEKAAAKRQEQMPPGAKLLVSGKLESFNGRITIPHPEHVLPLAMADRLPAIEPVWRLTAGLWPRQVGTAMRESLTRLPALPEWHDPALLRREKWPAFADALRAVQAPAEPPVRPAPHPPRVRRAAGRPGGAGRGARPGARPPRPRPGRATAPCAPRRWSGSASRPPASQVTRAGGDRRRPRRAPAACCGCCKAMSGPARRWWRC